MKKYKLIGVTEYAERHLNNHDLLALMSMIGCEIEESDNRAEIDNGRMFIMPDGEEAHIEFLQIEEVQPEPTPEEREHYDQYMKERDPELLLSKIAELEKEIERLKFKPCGEGDNICNCKSASECGYKVNEVEELKKVRDRAIELPERVTSFIPYCDTKKDIQVFIEENKD